MGEQSLQPKTGLLIVDLQRGFAPNPALVDAIREERAKFATVAMTRFVNVPGSLYRQALDWHQDGGELVLAWSDALVLDKSGYGLNAEHIDRLRQTGCQQWQLCGLETDACVLACAFSLWDAGLRPLIRQELCASSLHREAMLIARRQFGPWPD